jgi:hypothetical protein
LPLFWKRSEKERMPMPIRTGAQAECCLCAMDFATKADLDRHDANAMNQERHRNILEKGHRHDFGKSFEVTDPFVDSVLNSGPTVDFKEISHQRDLAQQIDALPDDPIEKLFSPYAARTYSRQSDEVRKFLNQLEVDSMMEGMGIR